MDFVLPDDLTEVRDTEPRDLVITSIPKLGKTAILAQLTQERNGIIFNLEKGGTDYVKGKFIDIYPEPTTSVADALKNYTGYRDALLKQKGKYKFLIVDNLSELDEMSEIMGTYLYMDTVQGKKFNRQLDETTGKELKRYKYGDKEFKLVTTLAEGYGYRYTRKWFLDQIDAFSEIAPYRIYAAHFRDKMIKNGQDETVTGQEINLTGALRRILPSRITALCRLVADGDKRFLSFNVDNDNIIAGSRASKLEGNILISEKIDKTIKTYWENIYV